MKSKQHRFTLTRQAPEGPGTEAVGFPFKATEKKLTQWWMCGAPVKSLPKE